MSAIKRDWLKMSPLANKEQLREQLLQKGTVNDEPAHISATDINS
jgi:hypothetical protein